MRLVCSLTTYLARNNILAPVAQRRPGADVAVITHKGAALAFAGVAPRPSVHPTSVAHRMRVPIPLFERHAGEAALVLRQDGGVEGDPGRVLVTAFIKLGCGPRCHEVGASEQEEAKQSVNL